MLSFSFRQIHYSALNLQFFRLSVFGRFLFVDPIQIPAIILRCISPSALTIYYPLSMLAPSAELIQ